MEFLIVLILFLGIYFIPTMVAYGRSHNNALAIAVLNVFIGWTLLGWIVATTWACTDNVKQNKNPPGFHQGDYEI